MLLLEDKLVSDSTGNKQSRDDDTEEAIIEKWVCENQHGASFLSCV